MHSDLTNVPPQLTETRLALHRLATYVIAPVRFQATGRFGLRAAPNGFGTPAFDGRQIRVEGSQLIDMHRGQETATSITTLQDAATFLDATIDTKSAAEHDSPPVGDVNIDLGIDETSSLFLGAWFNMAFDALREVAGQGASVDASEPQLWPGHFDPAIEMGDETHRASYGASPGDQHIAGPYLYTSVWWPDRLELDTDSPGWNAPAFTGAVLRLEDFGNADATATAVSFFEATRTALDGSRAL